MTWGDSDCRKPDVSRVAATGPRVDDGVYARFMVIGGAALLFFFLLAAAGLGIWVWALVDAIQVPDDSMYKAGTKLIWVLVIVLAQFIGAVIYLAAGRPTGGARSLGPSVVGGRDLPPPPPPPPAG